MTEGGLTGLGLLIIRPAGLFLRSSHDGNEKERLLHGEHKAQLMSLTSVCGGYPSIKRTMPTRRVEGPISLMLHKGTGRKRKKKNVNYLLINAGKYIRDLELQKREIKDESN
jgi:hypothetical protein